MDWAEGFGAGEAVGVAIVGGMRGFGEKTVVVRWWEVVEKKAVGE